MVINRCTRKHTKNSWVLQKNNCINMVFNYLVSMENFLKKRQFRDPDPWKHTVFHQISKGIRFLHQNKYVHRDLAMRNILLDVRKDGTTTAKLTDFGLTKPYEDEKVMDVRKLIP
eukprot:UN11299